METSFLYERKCWGFYHSALSSAVQKTLVGMNKMFFDEEKEEEDVVANLLLSYILLVASLERR